MKLNVNTTMNKGNNYRIGDKDLLIIFNDEKSEIGHSYKYLGLNLTRVVIDSCIEEQIAGVMKALSAVIKIL